MLVRILSFSFKPLESIRNVFVIFPNPNVQTIGQFLLAAKTGVMKVDTSAHIVETTTGKFNLISTPNISSMEFNIDSIKDIDGILGYITEHEKRQEPYLSSLFVNKTDANIGSSMCIACAMTSNTPIVDKKDDILRAMGISPEMGEIEIPDMEEK